jgi:hypothetical protein
MLKAFECFSSLFEPSRCAGSVCPGKVKDRLQVLLDEHGIAVRIGRPKTRRPGAAFVGFAGEAWKQLRVDGWELSERNVQARVPDPT